MANTTYFLDKLAGAPLTSQVGVCQKTIDFSKEPVDSGDTFDALNLPAGAFILFLAARVDTADTNTTSVVTFARSVTGSGPSVAITLDAENTNNISDADAALAGMYCPVADTIRGTVSVADATDGKVTIVCVYAVPAPATSV
jgi:hypothetical protein